MTKPKKSPAEEEAAREMAAKVPAGNYGWDAVVAELNRKEGHTAPQRDN